MSESAEPAPQITQQDIRTLYEAVLTVPDPRLSDRLDKLAQRLQRHVASVLPPA